MKKLLAIIGTIILALFFINYITDEIVMQFICEIKNAIFTK